MQDKKTIFIPDRPGNKLIHRHKNILENPHIGLIFFVPNTRETLRIDGKAELRNDHEVLNRHEARGRPASLVTKITVGKLLFLQIFEIQIRGGNQKKSLLEKCLSAPTRIKKWVNQQSESKDD